MRELSARACDGWVGWACARFTRSAVRGCRPVQIKPLEEHAPPQRTLDDPRSHAHISCTAQKQINPLFKTHLARRRDAVCPEEAAYATLCSQ